MSSERCERIGWDGRSVRAARTAIAGVVLMLVGLTGCASVDLRAGFPEVRAAVEERAATQVEWNQGTDLDQLAEDRLRAMLQRKLTVDDAVQIAMLNNRTLQAMYTDLGLAQADLVQAGLFKNPIIDAAVFFPLAGVRPDFQLSVAIELLDALYVPLRKRVAEALFEQAKLLVTGTVLDFVAQVRTAFYTHQANERLLELRQTVAEALAASLEVSRRLHDAGNITDLDLSRDRAQAEMAKLAVRAAEMAAVQSREQLNVLMGTWGEQTAWEIDGRLPEIPASPVVTDGVERVALDRSLDLAVARQRLVTAGQQLGYTRAAALIPDAQLGPGAEREGDESWKVGPVLSFAIPLFDQGQAKVGRAAAEVRRAQQEYYGLAVRIRAMARALQDRMTGARDRALYYRDIVLPLQERIVNEGQLQYNAMQIGIFQLLRDRERQIETAVAYVETLREYWLARADLVQLSTGRLPLAPGFRAAGTVGSMRMSESSQH
jgi:cobalt-zinc-cadmium efflux system outer membrane protein